MPGKPLIFKAFRASFTLMTAGYIGPADTAPGSHLPLRPWRLVIQSVAQGDDGPLPGVEALPHTLPHSPARIPGIQILEHVVIHSNDIHQGQGIAVPAVFHGIGQGDLPLEFLLRPEVHEDLIFNTPGGIGGQAHVLICFKGRYPFDEANGADGDQVVLVPGLSVIFFKGLLQETNPPR